MAAGIDWLAEQAKKMVSQWDSAIKTYYPEHLKSWRNVDEHFRHLNEVWNTLDAVKLIDWPEYIKPDATILDMGGGTGWLSAYLSTRVNPNRIYMLDSSEYFIDNMLPGMVRLLNGDDTKITTIHGLFSPLLFPDNSLDVVVASAALHHADNLENVCKEIHRVLKKDGMLFILNETPFDKWSYFLLNIKRFIVIFKDIIFEKYRPISPTISSGGILYDPQLGDKAYPLWYWNSALTSSGFKVVEIKNTSLCTLKNQKKGQKLHHFICKRND